MADKARKKMRTEALKSVQAGQGSQLIIHMQTTLLKLLLFSYRFYQKLGPRMYLITNCICFIKSSHICRIKRAEILNFVNKKYPFKKI